MTFLRALLLLCAAASLGGCAFGQKIDYRQSSPYLTARSEAPVELTVMDERPYTRKGGKNATFVGKIRGLYYNPFNVYTLSGAPLSSDIREAVRSALSRSAIKVDPAYLETSASPGHKLLLLKIREWKMDAYMKVRFDYDLTASVVDENGVELATKTAKNSGPVTNVLVAGGDALASVLNSAEITDALATPSVIPGGAPSPLAPSAAVSAPTLLSPSNAFDQCMRRVGKISDPILRNSSMSMCDDVK